MSGVGIGRILPDHELVVAGAGIVVRVRGREQIVRDIRTDVIAGVRPLGLGRHAADVADELLRRQLAAGVRVALNCIVAARPSPFRVPLDAGVQQLVNVRALASGSGGSPSPGIVVEVVPVSRVVAVLVAEVLGPCQGQEGEGSEDGLHDGLSSKCKSKPERSALFLLQAMAAADSDPFIRFIVCVFYILVDKCYYGIGDDPPYANVAVLSFLRRKVGLSCCLKLRTSLGIGAPTYLLYPFRRRDTSVTCQVFSIQSESSDFVLYLS